MTDHAAAPPDDTVTLTHGTRMPLLGMPMMLFGNFEKGWMAGSTSVGTAFFN